jgi:hypothetical protein
MPERVCAAFHNENVRGDNAARIQVDEACSFTAAKQKNVAKMKKMKKSVEKAGDTWIWTAIDADSKLIFSWLVDGRDAWLRCTPSGTIGRVSTSPYGSRR